MEAMYILSETCTYRYVYILTHGHTGGEIYMVWYGMVFISIRPAMILDSFLCISQLSSVPTRHSTVVFLNEIFVCRRSFVPCIPHLSLSQHRVVRNSILVVK